MIATSIARHCLEPALRVTARWQSARLSYKLIGIAAALLLCLLAWLAAFIADRFVEAVIGKFADQVALYADSVVSPVTQEIARKSSISEEKKRELDSIFAPTVIKRPVLSFRIWVGNRIIYSNSPELIGREFPPSLSREQAWTGVVAAELNRLESDDDEPTRALNIPILEVYSPLREAGNGRIFALAETHEVATEVLQQSRSVTEAVWCVFATVAFAIISLFLFVFSKVRREDAQFRMLLKANARVSEISEAHLQRLGSELHAGPVQLVGLALLKLDGVRDIMALNAPSDAKAVDAVRGALRCALEELGKLTEFLVPSRLETLSLARTVEAAVRRHELRTGVFINREIGTLPEQVAFPVKAAVHRLLLQVLASLVEKTHAHSLRVQMSGHFLEIEIRVAGTANDCDSGRLDRLREAAQDEIGAFGGTVSVTAWFGTVMMTAQIALDRDQLDE